MKFILRLTIASIPFLISCTTKTPATDNYKGLGTESVSSETIKKYAPGSLDPMLSRKIQNYLDIRSTGLGMLTPNLKNMFFSWKVTGTYQVWKLSGPNSFPVQLTGGEDSTSLVDITKDGKHLILSRDKNGEENPGLYFQSINGGELKVIVQKPKVSTHYLGQTASGKWLFFNANDINPSQFSIYRYEYATGQTELIFSEPGYWVISDIKNDNQFLLTKVISNNQNEVYEYSIPKKMKTPLLGVKEKGNYSVVYGPGENEYYLSSPRSENFISVWHLKNGNWNRVSKKIDFDVESIKVSENKKYIYYSINENGFTKSFIYNTQTKKPVEFYPPEEADHFFIGWSSNDGEKIAVGVETATSPKKNYVYDLRTKKFTQWTQSSSPEVDTTKFSSSTLEYYQAQDGTQIPMFVRRPSQCSKGKESNCSVIIHFHGGPEAQSQPGFNVGAQAFVDEGFIFVEPNVRGSSGYGQKWLNSDNGPLRLKVITDIPDAAKFIREKWKVKKVGIMGGSYGGYSTLVGMTKYAGSFDAGVEIVGMSNLVSFLMNTAPYRRALRIEEYGDPEKDKEALVQLSPMTYLNQINAPLLLIQGVNDPRVPVGEALQIKSELEKKNIPSELILFADEGHGAAKRNNQVIQLGKTIEFFKRHL